MISTWIVGAGLAMIGFTFILVGSNWKVTVGLYIAMWANNITNSIRREK